MINDMNPKLNVVTLSRKMGFRFKSAKLKETMFELRPISKAKENRSRIVISLPCIY